MSDQATIITKRILDCQLSRHQDYDTIGDYLLKIKNSINRVEAKVQDGTDSATMLLVKDLKDQIVVVSETIDKLSEQSDKDSVKIEFIFQVLKSLVGTKWPHPA